MKIYITSRLILLFAYYIVALHVYSQSSISGQVQESSGKPLAFANVLLLNAADSTLVKGMVSSETGVYHLDQVKPGQYLMTASMVGYKPIYSSAFTLLQQQGSKPMATLILAEDVQELGEVVVEAQKPLYEQQMDKLVVNVQSSITSAGATALDVLERSPGVAVNRQNNALSLIGKEGVVVMINGKPSRLPMEAILQMLSGMNASNIAKIELITTPSSSYDAEGNAGVINIILKKNSEYGTNGSYSLTMGYGWYEKPAASFNINHRTPKLNLFADGSFLHDHLWFQYYNRRTVLEQNQMTQINTVSNRPSYRLTYNARLGFDYTLSTKTTISGLMSGFNNRFEQFARNNTEIHEGDQLSTAVFMKDHEINQWRHLMGNLNLRQSISSSQQLNFDVDYLFYHHNNPHEYDNHYQNIEEGNQSRNQLKNSKLTPVRIWVGKADYTINITEQSKLEAGIKGTFSGIKNKVHLERLLEDVWKTDAEFSQYTQMREDIGAVYVNFNHQLGAKTKLQTGLRWEYTHTEVSAPHQHNFINRHYRNLFPSVFLSRDINEQNNLQFSYSRRITRPTYEELSPVFTFLDPYTYITGNLSLLPTITDAMQVGYQFKKSYMLTLQYSHDANAIRWMTEINPETNHQYYYKNNIKSSDNYSLTLNLPFTIASWWQMQNNLMGVWQKSMTDYQGELIRVSNRYGRINSTQTFTLPYDFTAELTCFYQTRSLYGIYMIKSFGSLNLGLQKKFNHDKGTLRLSVDDIFWTNRFDFTSYNSESHFDIDIGFIHEPRVIRLTYSRNFGNQNVKSAKRDTGSEEERKRVSGS